MKRVDSFWFQKSEVDKDTFGKSFKLLFKATPSIQPNIRLFTKITHRRMAITQIQQRFVPMEKGMKIIGHLAYKSNKKYNDNLEFVDEKSCQRLIFGIINISNLKLWVY